MSFKPGLTNPAMPGEITQAGMLVCVSDTYGVSYDASSKPDTAALASGFRQVGVLAGLPEITTGREVEEVKTGIFGITQEILFKSLDGAIKFDLYGVEPGALALGLGISPAVTTTGAAVLTVGDDTLDAAGHTVLDMASALTATPGDTIQVCAVGDVATSTNFAKVVSIDGSTHAITCDRLLRTPSSTGFSVKKATAVTINIGGSTPKKFSFAGLVDFPDGRVALVSFPIVYSAKPLVFGLGDGQAAVKLPIELKAIGYNDANLGVNLGFIKIWN